MRNSKASSQLHLQLPVPANAECLQMFAFAGTGSCRCRHVWRDVCHTVVDSRPLSLTGKGSRREFAAAEILIFFPGMSALNGSFCPRET